MLQSRESLAQRCRPIGSHNLFGVHHLVVDHFAVDQFVVDHLVCRPNDSYSICHNQTSMSSNLKTQKLNNNKAMN